MSPCRAEDDHGDHHEVGLEGWRPGRLPRVDAGRAAAPRASRSKVVCDALILDEESRSDTNPYIEIEENEVAQRATRRPSRRSATSSSST